MPPPIASTSPIRTLRRGEGVPAILGNAREDAKLVVAERLDHGDFAFREIGLARERPKRVAVAHDRGVGPGRRRGGEQSTESRVALRRHAGWTAARRRCRERENGTAEPSPSSPLIYVN